MSELTDKKQPSSEESTHQMKHIETISLANGLAVELYDLSRKVAGDRWLVKLLARIPVEVTRKAFEEFSEPDIQFQEYIKSQGSRIYFEQVKERNFIDEKERDELFNLMQNELKTHLLGYMGHKKFPEGVLKKEIKDFSDRRKWYN